jgi:hypothetical protein
LFCCSFTCACFFFSLTHLSNSGVSSLLPFFPWFGLGCVYVADVCVCVCVCIVFVVVVLFLFVCYCLWVHPPPPPLLSVGMVFTGPLVPIAMAGAAMAATGVYQGVKQVRHRRKIKRLQKAGQLDEALHADEGALRRSPQKYSTSATTSSSSASLRHSKSAGQVSRRSSQPERRSTRQTSTYQHRQRQRRSGGGGSRTSLSVGGRSTMVSCPRCSKISSYSGKPNVQVRCCFCQNVYRPPDNLVLPCPRCSKRNGIRDPGAPVRCFSCKTVFRIRIDNVTARGQHTAQQSRHKQPNMSASARF